MPGQIVKGSVAPPVTAPSAELLGAACVGNGLIIDDDGKLAVDFECGKAMRLGDQTYGQSLSGGSTWASPNLEVDSTAAVGDVVLELCVEVCLPCPVEGIWARYTAQVLNNLEDGSAPGDSIGFRMFLENPTTGTFPNSFFHNDFLGATNDENPIRTDIPFNGMRFFPYALPAGVHELCFEYRVDFLNLAADSGHAYLNQTMVSVMATEGVCH